MRGKTYTKTTPNVTPHHELAEAHEHVPAVLLLQDLAPQKPDPAPLPGALQQPRVALPLREAQRMPFSWCYLRGLVYSSAPPCLERPPRSFAAGSAPSPPPPSAPPLTPLLLTPYAHTRTRTNTHTYIMFNRSEFSLRVPYRAG